MFSPGIKKPRHILVNRVDAMGDVILALPVCGLIKKYYPGCKVSFLGRNYTKSIAMSSVHVDGFVNRDDWHDMSPDEVTKSIRDLDIDIVLHLLPDKTTIAACGRAKIKLRIGAMNRKIYWQYCNKLVFLRRKKARLSEAQLNIKLLPAINIREFPARNEVYKYYGFTRLPKLDTHKKALLDSHKFNIILHPLSNKNAKEWGLHNFSALLKMIDPKKFKVFITGSQKEKEVLADWVKAHHTEVTDLTGALDTDQLLAFIAAADGLIASSTGPVHIAAASGIHTLGLYEDRWVKRGERWGPIGVKAAFLECVNENMDTITPEMVNARILAWLKS